MQKRSLSACSQGISIALKELTNRGWSREDLANMVILEGKKQTTGISKSNLANACRQGDFCPGSIPVLISLRDVDVEHFNLLELIHSEFDPDQVSLEQTRQILKQEQVLILIDGLDEVPQKFQKLVLNQIRDFSKYGNNRYILTCRTQTVSYTLPNFSYVEVADFDESNLNYS